MPRNHQVNCRFSKEEIKIIEKKAEALGLQSAEFLRLVGLNCHPPIIEVEYD